MPCFGHNSTATNAAGDTNNRNGQLRLNWSFNYELDLPNTTPANADHLNFAHNSTSGDELDALLDKALAFAG